MMNCLKNNTLTLYKFFGVEIFTHACYALPISWLSEGEYFHEFRIHSLRMI